MAKKKVNLKNRETGKKEKHAQKQEASRLQDGSKAGAKIKGNANKTDFENVNMSGKGKKIEQGYENDNRLDNVNNLPTGLGNTNGTGFESPDLSGQLGKGTTGKGCLTTIIGAIIVLTVLMIL